MGSFFEKVYRSEHEQSRDQDLQGSVVTQTVLGGLSIYPHVAHFLYCVCQKFLNKVEIGQTYCNNNRVHLNSFYGHLVYQNVGT